MIRVLDPSKHQRILELKIVFFRFEIFLLKNQSIFDLLQFGTL